MNDINSIIWATPKQIDILSRQVVTKVKKDVKEIDISKLVELSQNVIDEFSIVDSKKISKPKNFKKGKFKPSCKKNKATNISKIFKAFEINS